MSARTLAGTCVCVAFLFLLDERFWSAVQRLIAAHDAGQDITPLAQRLLDADGSLSAQLQEAMSSLDTSALEEAARLSDGMGISEDAMIAVGCSVIASGPVVFAEAVSDPGSLVRAWDLSRGDLLLTLNPALKLAVGGELTPSRDPYRINLSIGDSVFGWPRPITEVVTYHQCRRQEKTPRWRAIFSRHDAEHLIIHLSAAPGSPQRVGKPYSHHKGYLEVRIAWDAPTSPVRLPGFVRTVLDAAATNLERA